MCFIITKGLGIWSKLNVCYLLSTFQTKVTWVWRDLYFTPARSSFPVRRHGWMSIEIQGKEGRGVLGSLWALERAGLKGTCFSFCQLEFHFQIPFWLYDQATAVFKGGHGLAGGVDLVRKEALFFFFPSKGVHEAAAFRRNMVECASNLGTIRTWVWKPAQSLCVLGLWKNYLLSRLFKLCLCPIHMVHSSETYCGYLVRWCTQGILRIE